LLNYVKQVAMSTSEKSELAKRGRPATGKNPIIGVRLPAKELSLLDRWAAANGYSRSAAIRRMIAMTARKLKYPGSIT
jgi:hypothetical protein